MTGALWWMFAGLLVVLVLTLAWAWRDAKRHPERWYSGPSLDERDGVGTRKHKP